jgi:hypothetical protein
MIKFFFLSDFSQKTFDIKASDKHTSYSFGYKAILNRSKFH